MSGPHVLGTSMNAREFARTVAVIAGVLGLMAYFAWFWHPGLSECDAAIVKTLKAPSTYRRISADGSGGSYNIEYDADNAFGVPLRGRGHCSVIGSEASWYERPEAASSALEPDDLSPDFGDPARDAAAAAEQAAAEAKSAAEDAGLAADIADPEEESPGERHISPSDAELNAMLSTAPAAEH